VSQFKKILVASILLISSISFAEMEDLNTIKVCQEILKIQKPRGITPDKCYNQSKDYLKFRNDILGSAQRYFMLSERDRTQEVCRAFLHDVVDYIKTNELADAKELFENDKAQSLDQSYYSYQSCSDKDKAKRAGGSASAPATAQGAQ
jgi:hypothetical protein